MPQILLASGILSSVLYLAADLLGSLLYPGYRYAGQEFSELTAAGSPVRPLMVWVSVIPYGALVLAFAAGIWLSFAGKRAARMTAVMLAGYAIAGTITALVFPMDTREVIAAGRESFSSTIHPVGTAVMSFFMLAAIGFGCTLLGRRFRIYSWATIAVLVFFAVLVLLQVGDMRANQPTPWMGLEERINIYATMLWVASLSVGVRRRVGR